MRRRFICDMNKNKNNNNIIKYTSTDGNILIPYITDFGVALLSNTYIDVGIILFKYEVKYIGDEAFYDCENLVSIDIPDSVTTIGDEAFHGCKNLTSIVIPNSVTSIGDWAFRICSSLTSIEIPNSVTSIGNIAFNSCSSLTSVYVKATTPPKLGTNVFADNSSNRKIYVPRTSLNAYKTASGWSEYASAIEPYDY